MTKPRQYMEYVLMPKKRKSRGRSKGGKGRSSRVQCSSCGAMIPRDKAKRVTRWVSVVDRRIAEELRKRGTYLPRKKITKFYCIKCSVHHHITAPRKKEERKKEEQEREEQRLKKMVDIEIKKRTPSFRYKGKYKGRGKQKARSPA